jgi:hypothetical protein
VEKRRRDKTDRDHRGGAEDLERRQKPQERWLKKRPAIAGLIMTGNNSTGFLDVGCLGSFGSLDNLKFYRISFLQSAVAVPDDRGIMNKDVWAVFAPNEAIAFRIVEPLDSS